MAFDRSPPLAKNFLMQKREGHIHPSPFDFIDVSYQDLERSPSEQWIT